MRRTTVPTTVPMMIAMALLATAVLPARRAAADNESGDTEIRITAPLDFVDCTAQTVTVLGLSVDISAATIEAGNTPAPPPSASPSPTPTANDSGADDGSHGGRHGGSSTSGCYYFCTPTPASAQAPTAPVFGCAALVQGQSVEVKLAGDQAPLAAIEVKQDGNAEDVEIKAPIQNVDVSGKTVTLLALAVDLSGAGLDGADDGDDDSQPIDLSELIVGQFVEVHLTSSTPPFVAAEAEVKNFANQVEVELEDHHHSVVDDSVDDVQVDVAETVVVKNPAAPGFVRKQLEFHTRGNGGLNLAGLPTGRAFIQITRLHDGHTQVGSRRVPVRANRSRHTRVRLHPGL